MPRGSTLVNRAALIAGLAVCLHAQTTTTSTTTDPASGVTTATTAASPNTANTGTGVGPRPIFLSGVVLMDDGSSLNETVNIQSICGPLTRTMAHSGTDGSFSFQWTTTTTQFSDASQPARSTGGTSGTALTGTRSGSRGLDPLANCELTAEAPGFTASRVSLYNRQLGSTDVGAIVLHRAAPDEGHTVSILALRAPKEAKRLFDKGTALAAAHKQPEAIDSFTASVALYPEYADAWLALGRAQSLSGDKYLAGRSFRKAMDLDAKLVGPWQELGLLACEVSKWEEAAHYLDQAVRLDPMDSAAAWYFDAVSNYHLGRYALAERSVRAEMKLDRVRKPLADYLLGMILIARQDLAGGAEALRNFIASSPPSPDAAVARAELARLESRLEH